MSLTAGIEKMFTVFVEETATKAARAHASLAEIELRKKIENAVVGELKPQVYTALGIGSVAFLLGLRAYLKSR